MSNSESIQKYFRRMYETEGGSVEEIFDALFAADVVFQIAEGKTMPREAFIQAAHGIRSIPQSERVVEASNFVEDGNEVLFHMYTRIPNVETGEPMEIQSDSVWRFNAEGKVVATRPQQDFDPGDVDATFRSLGVDG